MKGMQDQWYTFTMFDMESLFVRDIILGRINIPNENEMRNDCNKWIDIMNKIYDRGGRYKDQIIYQTNYILDLAKLLPQKTLYSYVKNLNDLDCAKEFLEWEHDKHENILTYRDKCFKSIYNRTKAAKFYQTWDKAFDDSLECYVSNSPNTNKLIQSKL